MKRRTLITAAFALVAAAPLSPRPAGAAAYSGPPGPPAASAAATIQQLGNQAILVLRSGLPPAERLARFRMLFHQYFDVPGIARFVLGRYWWAATPQQRQEFVNLFYRYVTLAYSQRLGEYDGQSLEVIGSRPADGGAIVKSRILRPRDAPPVNVEWRLTDRPGGYKITDVIVDGVSLAVTERSELGSVIARNGGNMGELFAEMRQKTMESEGD